MAERTERTTTREPQREHFSNQFASSSGLRRLDSPVFDDVIAALANAHENRRARQVTEWESMRRQAFRTPA